MKVLLIETATQVCSVALAEGDSIIARRESDEPNAHSSHLAVYVDEILNECGLKPADIDAVCVSSGPGSYTGLRIGVSSAKGLCYALGKPLIAVPTLESMAALYYRQHSDYQGMVCPMIDARRMECYTMMVKGGQGQMEILRDTHADILDDADQLSLFNSFLDRGEVTFIGDGAAKTQPLLGTHPNARFDLDFRLSAEGMADIAVRKLAEGKTEDIAYFEPFDLKDFGAKKSVVRGLTPAPSPEKRGERNSSVANNSPLLPGEGFRG